MLAHPKFGGQAVHASSSAHRSLTCASDKPLILPAEGFSAVLAPDGEGPSSLTLEAC